MFPVSHVTITGLGLIGGSLAYALRENTDCIVSGIDSDPHTLMDALERGAVHRAGGAAMLADAEAAGCKLYLVSGYRSVERQTALFKRKTNSFMAEGFSREEAEKQAAMWVARPGTSEHNTGLAADIVSADWYSKHSDLTADFEDTPEFEWLYAHCADYGFILRYPRGKENVTGVTYEPWHYRYVGKDAAKAIMQAGGTLEEYTGAHTA